jgi:hypothetical protein
VGPKTALDIMTRTKTHASRPIPLPKHIVIIPSRDTYSVECVVPKIINL